MKIIFQIFLATAVAIGAISCGQQESENLESETTIVVEDEAEQSTVMVELELKDGRERWKVNEEMYEYPHNCQKIVQKYMKEKDTDYLGLANALDGQIKKLISSCTMTGESHDALHLWLEPNMEMIEALSAAKNNEEAQPIVVNLNESYNLFDRYFQ
jgi:acetolactate synthase small subunit